MARSDQPGIVQMLSRIPLFHQASEAELEALSRAVKRVWVSRKRIIHRQGDACDGFNVLVYGRVKMSLVSWKGVDKPIQLVEPGETFGDITMFNGQPYFLNVQALEDSLFLHVPREAIVKLIEHDSRFALRMMGSLAVRVRSLVGDIEAFSLQPPAARLVSYLMQLLPANCLRTARVELNMSKNMVAAHLNLRPETLSRYFKELTEIGLVTLEGRSVLVHDVDRLGTFLREQVTLEEPRKASGAGA
jgi:CRP-like cAMP-binding protein